MSIPKQEAGAIPALQLFTEPQKTTIIIIDPLQFTNCFQMFPH